MPHYDAALTLREARGRYFAANGLGEGGYDDKWVRLAVGPLRFAFPNTAGRVRAVRYHDLHHVVTGYATDWTGEARDRRLGDRVGLPRHARRVGAQPVRDVDRPLDRAARGVARVRARPPQPQPLRRALERGAARRVGRRDAPPARARARGAARVARRTSSSFAAWSVAALALALASAAPLVAARLGDRRALLREAKGDPGVVHLLRRLARGQDRAHPAQAARGLQHDDPRVLARAARDRAHARRRGRGARDRDLVDRQALHRRHGSRGVHLAAAAPTTATASSAGAAPTCAATSCASRRRSRASTARACPCSPRCRAAASAAAST